MIATQGRRSSRSLSLPSAMEGADFLADIYQSSDQLIQAQDSCEADDFLRLSESLSVCLREGNAVAVAMIRPRGGSRFTDTGSLRRTGRTENSDGKSLDSRGELASFLASRLMMRADYSPFSEHSVPVSYFGAYSLLLWQPDCLAEELASELSNWREEYSSRRKADFAAGVAGWPECGPDLLSLLGSADDALTEAHSQRRIVCYAPPALEYQELTGRPLRLLVVDDNLEQVELLRLILKQNGYETLCAYDGKQALNIINRESPDLLLLDVGLPQLDGFDVLTRLRDLGGGKLPLPVIMLTGSNSEDNILRGFELGVSDYLIKPYDLHDLLSRIQNIAATRFSE